MGLLAEILLILMQPCNIEKSQITNGQGLSEEQAICVKDHFMCLIDRVGETKNIELYKREVSKCTETTKR